jgi:rhodanese-related sulfurtransferase
VRDVSPQEAADLIRDNEDNPDFIVLDVRPAERYAEGYIAGAINIDVNLPAFSDEVARLEKEDTYLVYCMAGITSRTAIEIMQELGFKRIYFLEGGINAWKEAGLPVVK